MTASGIIKIIGGAGPVTLVLFAMFSFAIQDVAVKLLSEVLSIWQLMFVRSTAVLGLLLIYTGLVRRGESLIPSHWGWPLIRAVVMSGAYLFFYMGIAFLPVTTAATAFFTGPLIITVMAAVFLREWVGPRRIAAVIVGFVGVLIIVRPGLEGFNPVTILPLMAAVSYAAGTIITRRHCRNEPSFALVIVHNLLYANIGMLGVVFVPFLAWDFGIHASRGTAMFFISTGWHQMSGLGVGVMLMTAFTNLLATLLIIRAYKNADASRLAPFEYCYLAFIPLLEVAIWGTWPDIYTITGMAMITIAGVFVSWREGLSGLPHMETESTDSRDSKSGVLESRARSLARRRLRRMRKGKARA